METNTIFTMKKVSIIVSEIKYYDCKESQLYAKGKKYNSRRKNRKSEQKTVQWSAPY